jgi:hypothetical protein
MKKLVLSFIVLLSTGILIAQSDCSDIFISEYVEGWDNNKAIELYNPTGDSITLDNSYRLIRWANGSTTSDSDPLYTLPLTGTIGPYSTWVIIQDTIPPGQDTMVWPALQAKADWLAPYDYGGTTPGGNVLFWNGDDAVSLQKLDTAWKDIDIFGEIGVRPLNWQGGTNPSGAWTDTKPYCAGTGVYLTKSKTLVRKHNVKFGIDRITMNHYGDSLTGGIPNSFYALKEYDSLYVNFFDSLGSHRCDCYLNVSSKEIASYNYSQTINIYPNPSNEKINVVFSHYSASAKAYLELFDAGGRFIKSQPVKRIITQIDISSLQNGVYLIKIAMPESLFVKKFIKQ